ncbi:MAG TPA: aminotransferase class V-fold PLP-dependent enzyme, partial [Polyangiaceae bacterium]|nr:aminotransferase class V-fold PLP-dependent enzyme [Polyangiaceae bacterium]
MASIYLDHNATTPLHPDVVEAMLPYLTTHFGNPSSGHEVGLRARAAVEAAREQVASLLGCSSEEVVFTSGGTESNNLALRGLTATHAGAMHVLTSAVEHPAIEMPCRQLERQNVRVTRVAVDSFGRVDPGAVVQALERDTVLVTVMLANNETGTLMGVREIAHEARARGVIVHTDAAQAVGKVPTRVADLGVDMLSIAGHKLYAPKGVGA